MNPGENPERTVLIVDDERNIRIIIKEILISAGYKVEEAQDGQVAFRKATTDEFSLLIIDLLMPNWGGFDTIRSLNLIKPNLNIIVMSAYLTEDKIDELKAQPNVIGWIKKPFKLTELKELVEKALT